MKNIAIGILLGIALKDTLLGTQFQNILAVAIATPIILYPVDCAIDSIRSCINRRKRLRAELARIVS